MSLKKKMGSKWFIVVNILLAIVLVGLINIDHIISFFGGDFDESLNIVVIDQENDAYDVFKNVMDQTKTLFDTELKTDIKKEEKTKDQIKEEIQDTNTIAIVFDHDQENSLKAEVISDGLIDSIDYQLIVQALTATKQSIALENSNIDKEELAKISSPIKVERTVLDDTKNQEEENMSLIMGTVFPTVILPFYMLVIFLVQMIGAEINEEKTTRSMEIIISNVPAKVHFFSKVASSMTFVLSQGLLLFLYAGLGLFLRNILSGAGDNSIASSLFSGFEALKTSGFVDKLIYIVPLTLILMILSFLAYALVAGILASMTVNMEDFQQIQTPIILICLASYCLAIMASMFDGSLFIRVLSYVPFISCLLSPALLTIGQIGIIDVIISIIILVVFNYMAIKHGLRIYKAGILNYSQEKVWTRLKKVIKTKE